MANLEAVIVGSLLACVGLTVAAFAWRGLRKQKRNAAAYTKLHLGGGNLPASLYPVIDPNQCTGCLSCIRACPEGDILGMVNGVAKLIEPTHCIGHGRCAVSCPTGAIRLVFGSSERGVDLPDVEPGFETSRRGLHIVGELGGMGLIKNAITQGVEVVDFLREAIQPRPQPKPDPENRFDVVIVGAGPAGLSTAAACRAAGLTSCVLEQDTMGGTIAHYPRQKIVMSEPVEVPIYGTFGAKRILKEDLMDTWQSVVKKAKLQVFEKVRVDDIKGDDGDFTIETSRGPVQARKVVLAIGRRGTPRRLGVPGEELPKVTYRLIDPEQYKGKAVAVVGGGDSAVEAAVALAEKGDATVCIVHRSGNFSRCKPDNVKAIDAAVAAGHIKAFFDSRIESIEPSQIVVLGPGDARSEVPNDFVIVSAGGELPTAFLKKVGINVRTHHGDESQPLPGVKVDRRARAKGGGASSLKARRGASAGQRAMVAAVSLVGIAVIAALAWKGWSYYTLPRELRSTHPLHASLRSSGLWGHGVGVVATAIMMLNFFYSARKRLSRFSNWGSVRTWLTFHMLIGVFTPLAIAFHAAFQSNNLLATSTAGSLAIVVGTGLVGRFLYGLIPENGGRPLELTELMQRWQTLKSDYDDLEQAYSGDAKPSAKKAAAARPAGKSDEKPTERKRSVTQTILRLPKEVSEARRYLKQVKQAGNNPRVFKSMKRAYREMMRVQRQIALYNFARRAMSVWRVLHVVLAITLVFIITAHIGVSLYLGYRWIWR